MEEFRNKVVARDYVKENYIKKTDLKEFIDKELKAVKKCNGGASNETLNGIAAAYRCILATFIER